MPHAFTGIGDQNQLNPIFARAGESTDFPLNALPPGESLPETAYQIVHDEAMLDGNSRLNLATFVGTWMDSFANRIYAESADKNMVDKDEYPQTAAIETRCWKMMAGLWNAPDPENAIGTSTIGSSEACMLAGLALKRRWQLARKRAAGKPTDKPNLILSSAVQVCWEKFCNYWDVEPRYVPISLEHKVLDGHDLENVRRREHDRRRRDHGRHLHRHVRAGRRDRRRRSTASRSRPGSTSRSTSTAHPAA